MTHQLTTLLESIRGKQHLTVSALAAESGVSAAALYKAESGKPVQWDTLERSYGRYCEDNSDLYAELLAAWALTHCRKTIPPERLHQHIAALREDEASYVFQDKTQLPRLSSIFETMSPPERAELIDFCELYARHEPTRKIVRTWTEAIR